MFILFLIFLALAYFFGSISSAVILSQWFALPDPRTEGSGNPGATNVLRLGGKQAAAVVLIADILKGFIPVLLAKMLSLKGMALGIVGLSAVIGHVYPVLYNFKGGKGVATGLGTILAMSFSLGLLAIIVWGAVAFITRYSSLAALVSMATTLFLSLFILGVNYFLPLFCMIGLIVFKHMENIERLRDGTESKIEF